MFSHFDNSVVDFFEDYVEEGIPDPEGWYDSPIDDDDDDESQKEYYDDSYDFDMTNDGF